MAHTHDTTASKNISTAFFLNFTFTIIELVGGIMTNSLAIISDALHDLGDTISLGLAWILSKVSEKKRSDSFTYGYKRFSLLGALINAVILIGGGVWVISNAIPRIMNPEPTHVPGMIGIAILGIIANGLAVYKMKSGRSLNEKIVTWHLLEDVLGWAAILVVAVVMYFTNLSILDPILSVLITLYILVNALKNMRETIRIFLQGTPAGMEMKEIENEITQMDGVKAVHDIRVWSLDGGSHIGSLHVVVGKEVTLENASMIKEKIRTLLHDHHIEHVTVEIEHPDEPCGSDT